MIGNYEELLKISILLAKNPKGFSITEISNKLGTHRSTVAKYLDMLVVKGDATLKQAGTAKIYLSVKRIPASSVRNFCKKPYIMLNSKLNIDEISDSFFDIFPASADFSGKPTTDLPFLIFDSENFTDNLLRVLNGETHEEISEEKGRDGIRQILFTFLPLVTDNGKEGVLVLLSDETDFHLAKEELKKVRERYSTLALGQHEYVMRTRRDGSIIFVNDAFCRHSGRSREELTGYKYTPIIFDQDEERVKRAFSVLSPKEPVVNIEYRVVQPDGQISWERWKIRGIYDDNGVLLEIQSYGTDITELKRLSEQLKKYHTNLEDMVQQRTEEFGLVNRRLMAEIEKREQAERELLFIQYAFDNASDSIILFDRSGRIYRSNETGCRLLGYTKAEMKEITVFDINPEITPKVWESMWPVTLSENQTSELAASVHRKKDGTIIPVELSRNFVRFGDTTFFCSIARRRSNSSDKYS